MEGASLARCAAQKELQMQEHVRTPGQPDSTDWKQKQSQGAEEKNHQCLGERGDSGVTGEEENRGIKADKAPGLWGKAESDCRSTVLSKAEVRESASNQDPCLLYSSFFHVVLVFTTHTLIYKNNYNTTKAKPQSRLTPNIQVLYKIYSFPKMKR